MILGRIQHFKPGPEPGKLHFFHFVPVHLFDMQLNSQLICKPFNVFLCYRKIPACINMENKGMQAPFLYSQVKHV